MITLLALSLLQDALAPDVSRSAIVNAPVSGKLGGKPFVPTRVEFKVLGPSTIKVKSKVVDETQQHSLTFRTGEDFFADQELSLWISFDKGQRLAPRTWNWKPASFNTPTHRQQLYPVDKPEGSVGRGLTTVFTSLKDATTMEGFSAHVKFEKVEKGYLFGRIAIVLPDKSRSYLNGTFKAKIIPRS